MNNYDFIFSIKNKIDFENAALRTFRYQYTYNSVYQQFCNLLGISKKEVRQIKEIPFLPISFFKTKKVVANTNAVQKIFESSGTTGSTTSKHYLTDLEVYKKSFLQGFERLYGSPEQYKIVAVLPSYVERSNSSLIYMIEGFLKQHPDPESGFYLNAEAKLKKILETQQVLNQKILLIGVSFALLDLIEDRQYNLGTNAIVMETGGMKGRRKELIREELHQLLRKGFGVFNIHSEYGMTELLSQAYATADGKFVAPPWMHVLIRSTEDALQLLPYQKNGGINIIDLANYNSCSFIATQDLGIAFEDGRFEVKGRFDDSDIRGCNLMIL